MSVFDEVVGQDSAVRKLRAAARAAAQVVDGGAGVGMTHAWLFTGPPGAGRSTAALAFAASLQCPEQGCGHCPSCRQVLAGTQADVVHVRPSGLSLGVKETRELVRTSASSPVGGRFRVMVLEGAERATEGASNALLKAIEEPPPRTVWLLCTPTPEDLLVTIRSRCRQVTLATPATAAVAELLVRREGVPEERAEWAARASSGHIGRARRLATDESAYRRREAVLSIPGRLEGLGAAVAAAAELHEEAEAEAKQTTGALDDQERTDLKAAYGEGATGKGVAKAVRGASGALKDLEERQKRRATRLKRDVYDQALLDLVAFYRDVLVVQLGARVDLPAGAREPELRHLAGSGSPQETLRRIEAIMECRKRIAANVHPQIALDAMTAALCFPSAAPARASVP